MAPPHARGSTLALHLVEPTVDGSPACAGIDPLADVLKLIGNGLPRMRGDRPLQFGEAKVGIPAPPHARGSTRLGPVVVAGLAGSPACAGIDPRSWSTSYRGPWLPRMRGDRPWRPAERLSDRLFLAPNLAAPKGIRLFS